ncbi:MAG: amidohydrolase family protein [Acidimicrobiia bacterium]|nr:amidohydrolase family protein [Acidimicrobiia bacterium]MDH3398694.1 amidohydrolase family protein [Acidimicrobiia bacterium]MDH5615385.1 amidohydrolase family protein [Acidimicrobiia bacterium]
MTRLLFRGGSVFDATDAPQASADVVVEDGRILEVGTGLDGDQAIDCTGLHLLPGLFDSHVHVMLSHIDMWRLVQTPFSYRFFEAAGNLAATLRAGITTVRDAGGADLGIKQAVEDGLIDGPRMQISLKMLSQTGGHGDGWMASGGTLALFPSYPGMPETIVDGVEEMRRKVRELIRDGADVIKVATSGGVLSPRDEPTHAHFRLAELEVLVEEATAAGIGVMAHAQATVGIKNAIQAGIRSIDHGIYLDDQAIEMMLERGTFLVPTLVAPTGVLRAAEAGAQIPETSLAKAREVIEVHRDSFNRAVQAGVKIAMGTDTGVTPHGENLAELTLMVEGGMTPHRALVATTRTAAELMGLDKELGTLEPGKRADLVVVDGDPFEVAELPERITQVWKDGHRVV